AITAAPAPPGVADGVRTQPYDRPLGPRPSALVLTGSGDAPRPRSGCGSPVKPHPRHNRCPAVQLSLAAGAEPFGESTVAESEHAGQTSRRLVCRVSRGGPKLCTFLCRCSS